MGAMDNVVYYVHRLGANDTSSFPNPGDFLQCVRKVRRSPKNRQLRANSHCASLSMHLKIMLSSNFNFSYTKQILCIVLTGISFWQAPIIVVALGPIPLRLSRVSTCARLVNWSSTFSPEASYCIFCWDNSIAQLGICRARTTLLCFLFATVASNECALRLQHASTLPEGASYEHLQHRHYGMNRTGPIGRRPSKTRSTPGGPAVARASFLFQPIVRHRLWV